MNDRPPDEIPQISCQGLLPSVNIGDRCRDVAQLGSALLWGSRGRGFESRRSDKAEKLGSVGFPRVHPRLGKPTLIVNNRFLEVLISGYWWAKFTPPLTPLER